MSCLQSWHGSACVMSTRTETRQDSSNIVSVPKVLIYLKSSQHEGNFRSKRSPELLASCSVFRAWKHPDVCRCVVGWVCTQWRRGKYQSQLASNPYFLAHSCSFLLVSHPTPFSVMSVTISYSTLSTPRSVATMTTSLACWERFPSRHLSAIV